MFGLSATETAAFVPPCAMGVAACALSIAALDKDRDTMKLIRVAFFGLTLAALVCDFFFVTNLWANRMQPSYGYLHFDFLAQFATIFVLITASLAVLQLWDHLSQEGWVKGETLSLLLFSVSGMILFVSTTNMILLFLAFELLSVPLYAITAAVRLRQQAIEGGMKYFVTGAVASSCLLMGIVLIYGLTGSFELQAITAAIGKNILDPLMLTAIALVSVGLFFKVSAVPFHQWTPDAYEAAPHPIAGFMSVATKGVVLIVLLRIFPADLMHNPEIAERFKTAVGLVAVLSMVLGNLTALAQDNAKRMLAYSSISHAGYMLLAFVAGTPQAYAGLLLYLLVYMAMNMGAFGLFTSFGLVGEKTRYINLRGLGWRRPDLGISMALCMFSLSGLPPMGGFFGKYMIFKELVNTGHVWLALIGVLASLVSVYYYMRIISTLFMEKDVSIANSHSSSMNLFDTVDEKTGELPEASLSSATLLICGMLSLVMGFAQFYLVDGFVLRAIRESLQFIL